MYLHLLVLVMPHQESNLDLRFRKPVLSVELWRPLPTRPCPQSYIFTRPISALLYQGHPVGDGGPNRRPRRPERRTLAI